MTASNPGYEPGGWREQARCDGMGLDIFFPLPPKNVPRRRGQTRRMWATAKATCALCPVSELCLEFAIESGEDEGCFGGMTPDERTREIRRRAGDTDDQESRQDADEIDEE